MRPRSEEHTWGLLPLRLLCCVPLSGEHSPSGLKAGVRALEIAHAPRGAAGLWHCLPVTFFFFFSVAALAAFRCCARLRGGRTALAVSTGRQMSLAAKRRGAPPRSERPAPLAFLGSAAGHGAPARLLLASARPLGTTRGS
ncbi:hypothetical protein NDU88_009578 [Pleurodeles waltl]|uniref:Uncharacterized protein n=1 Tax=Pleurodeles waltl TaxID=8319 RepID=A0AAV7PWC2_PLEWA|nr:hypothetical protein NDU88_009578 [Pleurodeles waltl]